MEREFRTRKEMLGYSLRPMIGEDIDDIDGSFDGDSEKVWKERKECAESMIRANKRVERQGFYEKKSDKYHNAAISGVEEGQKIGFNELAEMITEPSAIDRVVMANYLENNYEPAIKGPRPELDLRNSVERKKRK